MAHEINNPVNIVATEAGWLEDLLEEGEPDEGRLDELRRVAAEIRRRGRRIGEITRKLLFSARDSIPAPARWTSPRSWARPGPAAGSGRAEELDARLELDVAPDLPHIVASPAVHKDKVKISKKF